ncbi:MAG: glycosyltransferase family A protein [Verrucomicrobiota bacterium]
MTCPPVSILIPCYNAAPWVGAAINSALAQTWQPLEVIVLDDGSTDDSAKVIAEFGDRIKYLQTPNRGQNPSRNKLTELSTGDWLVYLDADDEYPPDHIEKMMVHSAKADAVYSSLERAFYRENKKVDSVRESAHDYDDTWSAAFRWKYPNTSSFMFRRSSLMEVGGWNESVQNCTDYALYFDLLLHEKQFKAAPETWTTYRQWSATQAVYENDLRRATTRINLMWEKALARDASNHPLTPSQRKAFGEATFGCIRTLYQINSTLAQEEYQRLREWDQSWLPSGPAAPKSYRIAHAIAGFRGAERFASATRALRKATRSHNGSHRHIAPSN